MGSKVTSLGSVVVPEPFQGFAQRWNPSIWSGSRRDVSQASPPPCTKDFRPPAREINVQHCLGRRNRCRMVCVCYCPSKGVEWWLWLISRCLDSNPVVMFSLFISLDRSPPPLFDTIGACGRVLVIKVFSNVSPRLPRVLCAVVVSTCASAIFR